MDERKKKIVAGVLVLAVVVVAAKMLFLDGDENVLPKRSLIPDAELNNLGANMKGVDAGMPSAPVIAGSTLPPNTTASPPIAHQDITDPAANAPHEVVRPASDQSGQNNDSVGSLLAQSQTGELRTKVAKQEAEVRRSLAEVNAHEAQARLAATKAKAEAAYIESNPERYAQQSMKGAGGFDPSTLPALNPQSAMSGFGGMSQQGSSGAPSLRMISGEGKDKMAVLMVGGLVQTAKVGSIVGDYTLKAIDDQFVVLEKGGKRVNVGFAIPAARALVNQTNQPQTGAQQQRSSPAPRVATPGDSSNVPNLTGQSAGGAQSPF